MANTTIAGAQTRWLTIQEVCEILDVSYDTWAKWRTKKCAPPAKRLPNGSLRVRSDWLEDWMFSLPEAS